MNKLATFAFTAGKDRHIGLSLLFASLFLVSCGEHTFDDFLEDIFGSSSSAGEEELSSSSSARRSSSSSAGQSRSSSSISGGGSSSSIFVAQMAVERFEYTTPAGKIMQVFYIMPPVVDSETKVIFSMRGDFDTDWQLNPNSYRSFRPLSAAANAVVICPSFNDDVFTYGYYRNFDITGTRVPPYEDWSFHHIDDIFLQFARQHNLSAKTYILMGHSLGGGFVSRTFMFSNSQYMEYAFASGARPNPHFDEEHNHPQGIKNLMQFKSILLDNLSRKNRYLLIGSNDTAAMTQNSYQGSNRVEGSINYFESAKNYARENNVDFNWKFITMPGANHVMTALTGYVLDAITGNNYKKENPNAPAKAPIAASGQERLNGTFHTGNNYAIEFSGNAALWLTGSNRRVIRIDRFTPVDNSNADTKGRFPDGYRINGEYIESDKDETSVGSSVSQTWYISADKRSILNGSTEYYRYR